MAWVSKTPCGEYIRAEEKRGNRTVMVEVEARTGNVTDYSGELMEDGSFGRLAKAAREFVAT